MFEHIGRVHDDEAGRRRAASGLLLTLGSSMALCVGAVIGGLHWAPSATAPPRPPMVEYQEPLPPPGIEIELPPVPQLAAARVRQGEVEATPRAPVPDELVDPPELTEPPDRVADVGPVQGDPDGGPDGEGEGDPNGREGGVRDGSGTVIGSLPSSVQQVHRSEVRPRMLAEPSYPAAARGMNLGEVTCRVRVQIDERGRPEDLQIDSCPQLFHDEVRRAVQRSRWYPFNLGGVRHRAQFAIAYRFTTAE